MSSPTDRTITVFADVWCPFAYAGLTRILAYRDVLGPSAPPLHVRAWPLELVNDAPLVPATVAAEIDALRRDVAPDLFAGFAEERFPTTTLPALAAEHAAYAVGLAEGMAFSLAVRRHLFEDGADIGDPAVVDALVDEMGLPHPTAEDRAGIERDHQAGVAMGVQGSPHFFTGDQGFFCPTLDIRHEGDQFQIEFDPVGFDRFITAAFG